MKTLVKTFAIALLSVVSFVASATDNNGALNANKTFAVGLYQTINTMKMNVCIDKLTGKNVTILLKNEDGEVLHTEYLMKKDTAYRCAFDLTDLEDGKYSFEITDGASKVVKNVQVSTAKSAPATADRFISMK